MTKVRVDSMIECNTSNRALRPKVIDAYARDMLSGNWRVTHQGIAVSSCGKMIDGQHRLHALRKAGYPAIVMLVVTGLEFDVQKYVDQQAKRNMIDLLRFSFDASFSRNAPAIARLLIAVERSANITPTVSEIAEKVQEHLEEIQIVSTATKSSKGFYAASHLCGFVKVMKERPEQTGNVLNFIKNVIDGDMLSKTSPAFHLRAFIINTKGSTACGSITMDRYSKTVRATNAYLDGKPMGVLRA
jgi:hypothetical protein